MKSINANANLNKALKKCYAANDKKKSDEMIVECPSKATIISSTILPTSENKYFQKKGRNFTGNPFAKLLNSKIKKRSNGKKYISCWYGEKNMKGYIYSLSFNKCSNGKKKHSYNCTK